VTTRRATVLQLTLLFALALRVAPASAQETPVVPSELPTASSSPPPASAEPSAAVVSPAPDEHIDERLAFIESRLASRTPALNRWFFGWIGIYSALTIAQGVVAIPFSEPSLRYPAIVGSVSSVVGLAVVLILPPSGRTASSRLRRVMQDPGLDRAAQLAAAERMLRVSAADEAFGHSWLAHAATVIVPAIGSAIIWFGFNLPVQALINFVAGGIVAEAEIWTEPWAGVSDLREYERRFGTASGASPSPAPRASVRIRPMFGGFALSF
jgi:hypothetical protein